MDRNTEFNNNGLPDVTFARNTFKYNKRHMTTFNVGELVPFYVNTLVQPGDTFKINMSLLLRLTTPYFQTMDNLYADVYFFAAPWTILWDNTKAFWGENELGSWAQTVEYEVPAIKTDNMAIGKGTILDHMAWPTGITGLKGTRLGLNMYHSTFNYWFRDQNVTPPVIFSKGDEDIQYDGTALTGGKLHKVSKFHDYITSALPQPQKGNAINLPLGTQAPIVGNVIGNGKTLGLTNGSAKVGLVSSSEDVNQRIFTQAAYNVNVSTSVGTTSTSSNTGKFGLTTVAGESGIIFKGYADLTSATAATINALRLSATTQQILESMARFGSRYKEIIQGLWGVTSPEDIQQISEYLGGKRVPINIEAVLQTSATNEQSPQGNVAGYSVTVDSDDMFVKSFTTHSVIIGLICVRQDHTYSQAMPAQYSKFNKFDYYWNAFANIGEQPIYNRELYAQGTDEDNDVYGYKPAWQEYRQEMNEITGELRPQYELALDEWHYGDHYDSLPVLSQEFIEETPVYVDRTIVIPHTEQDQFIMDSVLNITKISEVAQFSIPGIDRF